MIEIKQLRFFGTTGQLRALRKGPRPMLPTDLICKTSSYLQEDLDLAALASFNRVCRLVHHVTLPFLYRTLALDDTSGSSWEKAKSRACDGWNHTTILLLQGELFKDLKRHASMHPSNDDETSKLDAALTSMFPRLLCVLVHTRKITDQEDNDGELIAMTAELHIYGSVTPPDIVYACRYPPSSPDHGETDSECSEDDGSRFNDTSTYSESMASCDIDINLIVLHKNARLVMDGQDHFVFPSVDVFFETYGRTLDLRLLGDSETRQDTLAACMWLLNEGNTSCEGSAEEHTMQGMTRVLCSWDMIQPVVETYRTQRPVAIQFELAEICARLPREIRSASDIIRSIAPRMSMFRRGDTIVSIGGPVETTKDQSSEYQPTRINDTFSV